MAIGLGQMAMSIDNFNSITPAEFITAYLGYLKRQEEIERMQWERCRWQTWIYACVQSTKKISMKEFAPLPWDEPIEKDLELTEEQRAERVKNILSGKLRT